MKDLINVNRLNRLLSVPIFILKIAAGKGFKKVPKWAELAINKYVTICVKLST